MIARKVENYKLTWGGMMADVRTVGETTRMPMHKTISTQGSLD